MPSFRPNQNDDSMRAKKAAALGQFVAGSGEEQTYLLVNSRSLLTERKRTSNQSEGLPGTWLWTFGAVEAASIGVLLSRSSSARPSRLQLCGGLARFPPQLLTNRSWSKGVFLFSM